MYSLTGAEVFAFSVCSCKSPPFVRLEEGFLPAGLCKLLEIKDYIISYHSSILVFFLSFSLSDFVSLYCKCVCDLTGSMHSSLLIFSQYIYCLSEARMKLKQNRNQIYCQVGFHIKGILLGMLVLKIET